MNQGFEPSVSIGETGLNIRQLMSQTLEWGPPLLDSGVKLLFMGVQNEVRLRIYLLVTSDGLSLSKSPASSVKQTITHKGEGAMNLRGTGKFSLSLASELFDAGLKGVGAGFVTPLVKAGKLIAKQSFKGIPDDRSRSSDRVIASDGNEVGTSKLSVSRFNKLQVLPKSIEGIVEVVQGMSAFFVRTDLVLKPIGGVLSIHTNLPLGSVDREHARPIFLRTLTRVSTLIGKEEKPIYTGTGELQIAPARYVNVKEGRVHNI